jgi:hypothetical protein
MNEELDLATEDDICPECGGLLQEEEGIPFCFYCDSGLSPDDDCFGELD